jgi:hypothetical protein
VTDWSGDGTRLLEVTPNGGFGGTSTLVRVVDLATGAIESSFRVSGDNVVATFTRPSGHALYVNTSSGLARYSQSGIRQVGFPSRVAGLGAWTTSWLESPDGVYLVLGTNHGLALFSNDGRLVARLPVAHQTNCLPMRWWSSDEVLANCNLKLFVVPMSGAAPTQLIRNPHGSYGFTDAFQVNDQTFLQDVPPCGTATLSVVQGNSVVPVSPRLPGDGAAVVATTSSSLALLSRDGCTGQNFISWYTPATNSVLQVLGPPLTSGYVNVLGYPDPNVTGYNMDS